MRFPMVLVALATAATAMAAFALNANSAPSRSGALTVAFSFDTTRGIPVEGAISYMSIERDGGRLLMAELNGRYDERSITIPARAGRYRVRTFQRFCNGNCGNLDEATLACSRSVQVKRGERVRARVSVAFGSPTDEPGCRIRVRR